MGPAHANQRQLAPVSPGKPARQLRGALAVVATLLCGLGCGGSGQERTDPRAGGDGGVAPLLGAFQGEGWLELVDHTAWQPLEAEDDPHRGDRPDLVQCGSRGFYQEPPGMELDTACCNYLAVSHPLQVALEAGDTVAAVFSHATLRSLSEEEGLSGHIALGLEGVRLWERNVPIPAEATPYEIQVLAPFAAPVGAALQLHLHNHGYNTWRLVSFRTRRAPSETDTKAGKD